MIISQLGFCLVIGLLALNGARADTPEVPQKVSFYFAAHQDDWQLFMNPSAFQDVVDGKTKAVFVHMTAGDAGLGAGTGGRKHPYYRARENGAETAIRFMADSGSAPGEKLAAQVLFDGHLIYRVSYRNTVSYFLRVPDGNPGGTGYEKTGAQSLALLAEGRIAALTAVDGSTSYDGWKDLVATIRALIDYERGNAPSIQLNVGELDTRINPGDHSDHRMTAKAALDAARGLSCARRLHFTNYASARMPENLSAPLRDMESAAFAVTNAGILALDHVSTWKNYYRSYLGRNYFRVEEGSGACKPPAAADTSQAVAGTP